MRIFGFEIRRHRNPQSIIKLGEDLTDSDIARLRKQAIENALVAYMIMPIKHRVSLRTERAIFRAYKQDYLDKPIEQLTDKEILSIRNIGPKSLKEIRRIVGDPTK